MGKYALVSRYQVPVEALSKCTLRGHFAVATYLCDGADKITVKLGSTQRPGEVRVTIHRGLGAAQMNPT